MSQNDLELSLTPATECEPIKKRNIHILSNEKVEILPISSTGFQTELNEVGCSGSQPAIMTTSNQPQQPQNQPEIIIAQYYDVGNMRYFVIPQHNSDLTNNNLIHRSIAMSGDATIDGRDNIDSIIDSTQIHHDSLSENMFKRIQETNDENTIEIPMNENTHVRVLDFNCVHNQFEKSEDENKAISHI